MKRDSNEFFKECYGVAIAAAQPDEALARLLPEPPRGRLVVVGAGKGAAQLAQSFERLYVGALSGVVVTRYGYGAKCDRIEVIEAAHPVPDKNSFIAGERLLEAVNGLSEDDLVVALICGGGSALLAAPIAPMALDDEIVLNQALLSSGAPIGEMNTLRRHLSKIKGGRLAEAAKPARVVTYLVSDVPGDDPAEVASGPTVAGKTTPEDARAVIEKYKLDLPDSIQNVLESPAANCPFTNNPVHILASAATSLNAVEKFAQEHSIEVMFLGDAVEGEAREVAIEHAKIAIEAKHAGREVLIISGGETTVTLKGKGKGGRNTEYLLSFAIEIAGQKGISAFAADTDGIDGSETNAGAFADWRSVKAMKSAGCDAQDRLDSNDAYTAFDAIGAIFSPGPSGTNVNDLRLIWVR